MENNYSVYTGDALTVLKTFAPESVHCCVTSPPYFNLRDYGIENQIGLEPTPQLYVERLVAVFSEVMRVLRPGGTLWLNLGDSYAANGRPGKSNLDILGQQYRGGGHKRSEVIKPVKTVPEGLKPKDLLGIPWRVAFALQAAGWYLRQDIIWHKPNAMPESVIDRCTKAHEYIFLLSKSPKYYYDSEAIKEAAVKGSAGSKFNKGKTADHQLKRSSDKERLETDKRNKRSVWSVATVPYKDAHYAVFPPALIEPCILAGSPPGGVVLDPFCGSGTTLQVALQHGRQGIGIEINPKDMELIERRLGVVSDT